MECNMALRDGSNMLVHHVLRDDGIAFQKAFGKKQRTISVEHGHQRRLLQNWGIVMRDNHAMLGLARRLGFEVHRNTDNANTNIATKKLIADRT